MAPHLSVVFQRLVRLGSFPACWIQANVTPIPKGPSSSSVANYRPISVTSVLSKFFERLVSVRVDLWNAVVCFQPPSLLIGKVWVPVMQFCVYPKHCRVHWRMGRRLGSCRLISVQPLIGSTIWVFSGLGFHLRPGRPEWQHRQCVGLVFRRSHARGSLSAASLVICSPARIAVCNTWSSGGTALCMVGGCNQSIESTL